MDAADAQAIARVRKWTDPRAAGSPTKRMASIWPTPLAMCLDLRRVMALLDERIEG